MRFWAIRQVFPPTCLLWVSVCVGGGGVNQALLLGSKRLLSSLLKTWSPPEGRPLQRGNQVDEGVKHLSCSQSSVRQSVFKRFVHFSSLHAALVGFKLSLCGSTMQRGDSVSTERCLSTWKETRSSPNRNEPKRRRFRTNDSGWRREQNWSSAETAKGTKRLQHLRLALQWSELTKKPTSV